LKLLPCLFAVLRGAPLDADHPSTRIRFSALDRDERPRLGLGAEQFRLKLDGKPAVLEEFQAGRAYADRSVPLIAWILLDFNPRIGGRLIADQGDAAAGLLDLVHPDSVIGVKVVSDRVETLAPLGRDRADLKRAFAEFDRQRKEFNVQPRAGTVMVGKGGMLRAVELSLREIEAHVRAPGAVVADYRAGIMVISDGNLDPVYNRRTLLEDAARLGVAVYPVFVPHGPYGRWLQDYFDLGTRTGGVGSVFGALHARSTIDTLARGNVGPNALQANLLHMLRDLNGKYSFVLPAQRSHKQKIEIECTVPGVRVRLARRELP
jgi:hypothetical protein